MDNDQQVARDAGSSGSAAAQPDLFGTVAPASKRPGRSTAFYTPPVVAKTLVAQALGDGNFALSAEQLIKDVQAGMRAAIHAGRKFDSDGAFEAHLTNEIARLDLALEVMRGEWAR
jgi:hypothetical protein